MDVTPVLQKLDEFEKAAAAVKPFVITLDTFIDHVDDFCKSADMDDETYAALWGTIGTCMEKASAGPQAVPPMEMDEPAAVSQQYGAPPPMPAATPAPAQQPGWWQRFTGAIPQVSWGDPGTWGKALAGAGAAGLGGLLYTALRGRGRDEERKPYLRNMLLTGLLGGLATPYLQKPLGQLWGRVRQYAGA